MWSSVLLLVGALATNVVAMPQRDCMDSDSCRQPEVRKVNPHKHNHVHGGMTVTEYVTIYATKWVDGQEDVKTTQEYSTTKSDVSVQSTTIAPLSTSSTTSTHMDAFPKASTSSEIRPYPQASYSQVSTEATMVATAKSSSIEVYSFPQVSYEQVSSKATTLTTIASTPKVASGSRTSAVWSQSLASSSIEVAPASYASMSPTYNNPKAVFAHYMVGEISYAEAQVDISEAISMGLDAFALNVQSSDDWVDKAIANLFEIAEAKGFKLFLSFDMSYFQNPADFFSLLASVYNNPAYYRYNNLPFVSTFYGGTLTFGFSNANAGWQALYRDALDALGMPTYFVPSFQMTTDISSTSQVGNFWDSYSMADGQFNWDGSWPYASQGMVNVSCTNDEIFISEAASKSKTYMMGISSLQFKHLDSANNWFRRGGLSLALRVVQILNSQPDFVEIQTWNDGGESHYIGNVWPDMISTTTIGSYITGYNHTGWQNLLGPFATAYKNGAKTAAEIVPINGKQTQGVFWHATLLTSASCRSDPIGQPSGYELMADVIEVALTVATGATASVKVYSGGKLLTTEIAVEGLNAWEVNGLTVGDVRVVVEDGTGRVLSDETGSISVMDDATLCNYNPQVVGL